MAKTASQSGSKFVERASVASGDYVAGAEQTSKDQAALAIAAKDSYKQGVQQAITRGAYEKGLQKAGKQAWLDGVRNKGASRFSEGVANSASKYVTNSAKYDNARNAAASLPRGPKGDPKNLQRVTAVVNALRTVKVGA